MLVRSTAVPREIRTSPFAENIFQDICGVCRVDHRYQGVSASLDSVTIIVTVGITAHGNGFSFHTEPAQSCCRSCGRGSTVPTSPNALFDRRHLSSTPYPEEAIKNMMTEKKNYHAKNAAAPNFNEMCDLSCRCLPHTSSSSAEPLSLGLMQPVSSMITPHMLHQICDPLAPSSYCFQKAYVFLFF